MDKLLVETGAGGRWPVNRRQQCTNKVAFCPLGTGVLVFWRGKGGGRIRTVFSVTSLLPLSNKICKHRSYNGTREELGKYLILLSLFTGCFHKLRNMGETGGGGGGDREELPASSCSRAWSGLSSSLLWVESPTWKHDQLREARSQAGRAADCDYPKSPVTGSENATCKLLPQEMASKVQSPLLEKISRRGRRRMGVHCHGFSVWVSYKMQGGGRNWLSSISFLATEGMNWFTGKVLGLFFFWGGWRTKTLFIP